ncbi:MAG: OPT/YSL family transporter, partial [Gemmatimonadota bacterium]
IYLPISLMTPIFVGGLMRQALTRRYESAGTDADGVEVLAEKREQGVLYASGLIAGAALVGVLIGGAIYGVTRFTGDPSNADRWVIGHHWSEFTAWSSPVIGTLVFVGLCGLLWRAATRAMEAR